MKWPPVPILFNLDRPGPGTTPAVGRCDRVVNIGSDKVWVEPERLIIHAAEPMDLPIREFCRVPLYFQGRKYYLRSKRKVERPHAMSYELWPWPTDLHESSTRQVVYDEAYVVER